MAATNNRFIKFGLILLLILAAGTVAMGTTRWFVYKSEAYSIAIERLRTSEQLLPVTGNIRSTSLSWFDDTTLDELQVNGIPSGSAAFTVLVEGDNGSAVVKVRMTRGEHGWAIASATIEDLRVPSPRK